MIFNINRKRCALCIIASLLMDGDGMKSLFVFCLMLLALSRAEAANCVEFLKTPPPLQYLNAIKKIRVDLAQFHDWQTDGKFGYMWVSSEIKSDEMPDFYIYPKGIALKHTHWIYSVNLATNKVQLIYGGTDLTAFSIV